MERPIYLQLEAESYLRDSSSNTTSAKIQMTLNTGVGSDGIQRLENKKTQRNLATRKFDDKCAGYRNSLQNKRLTLHASRWIKKDIVQTVHKSTYQ